MVFHDSPEKLESTVSATANGKIRWQFLSDLRPQEKSLSIPYYVVWQVRNSCRTFHRTSAPEMLMIGASHSGGSSRLTLPFTPPNELYRDTLQLHVKYVEGFPRLPQGPAVRGLWVADLRCTCVALLLPTRAHAQFYRESLRNGPVSKQFERV